MSDNQNGEGSSTQGQPTGQEVSDPEAVAEETIIETKDGPASEYTYGLDTTLQEKYAAEAPQDLIRTSILMIQNQDKAYYGHFLAEIKKHRRYDIPTVKVTVNAEGIAFGYNPYFIKYCVYQGQQVLESVVEHELLHLTYLHPELTRMFVIEGGKDSGVYGAAMDAVVNDQLDSNAFPMCTLCSRQYMEDMKTPEGIRKVREALTRQNKANQNCPSCYGTGLEGITTQKVNMAARRNEKSFGSYRSQSTQEIAQYLEKNMDVTRSLNITSQHGWNSTPIPDTEDERLHEEIIKTMVNHIASGCKSYGSAGDALRAFKEITAKKRVPYILQIRAFLGASMKSTKAPTRYRPNRRFGWDYPGTRSHPAASYIAAFDTSMSMGDKEIQEIVNELSALKEYSDTIEVRCILYHSSVYADVPLEEFDLKRFQEKYRSGGTDFDAVFQHIFGTEEEPKQTPPTTLVMLTDGYCGIGVRRQFIKSRCNLAWLITEQGSTSYITSWDKGAKIIEINSS